MNKLLAGCLLATAITLPTWTQKVEAQKPDRTQVFQVRTALNHLKVLEMSADDEVKTSGSQKSLKHLNRVGLEVERLPGPLTEEGVDPQHLVRFLQERLSKAPVRVVSRAGALHLKGAPTLFLNVSLFEREPESYVYVITLELVQEVSLERLSDSDVVAAPTWRAQTVGFTRKGQLSLLNDPIGATADAFVTDLAGNSK